MREIALAQTDPATAATAAAVAFMIDQSHNVEGKIDAMVQSVMNIQTAYAKALLVDEDAVAAAQREGDVLGAHRLAARRRSRPTCARCSRGCAPSAGVEADPVAAFRRQGHAERLARERGTARVESAYGSSEPLRIALFVTCIGDAVSPEAPRAVVARARAARPRGRLPAGADLLRPAPPEQRLPPRGARARAAVRRDLRAVRGDRLAVVVVRRHGARARAVAPRPPLRALGAPRRPARRRPTSARRSRTASRTTRPATRCASRASATRRASCSRAVRGLELVELERAEECCGFGGTFAVKNADTSSAMLADKCAAIEATRRRGRAPRVDGSCLLQIGGGLVAPRLARARRSTSPRSSPS